MNLSGKSRVTVGLFALVLLLALNDQAVGSPDIGYAILVAGPDEQGLSAIDTWRAYETLLRRGFDTSRIFYISPALCNLNSLKSAFNWASVRVGPDSPLILYFAGEGGADVLVLEDAQVTPSKVRSPIHWALESEEGLGRLPAGTPTLIILDSCFSGGFITTEDPVIDAVHYNDLGTASGPDRIIITSAHHDKETPTFKLSGSFFSRELWLCLEEGFDVRQAFIKASERANNLLNRVLLLGKRYDPWLDDNGDAVGHPPEALADDGTVAGTMIIGTQGEAPSIGEGAPNPPLFSACYTRNGGALILGHPVNEVHRWWDGYIQDFRGGKGYEGAIMQPDGMNSAYAIYGAIWAKYLVLGGAGGLLGYPLTDETEGPRSSVSNARCRYNRFQGGAVVYREPIGGYEGKTVFLGHGIFNKWEELGYGGSSLGLPITDEYINESNYPQADFEGGYVTTTNGATYEAFASDVPPEVLSPVIGDLEVVYSIEQCAGTKWCFNQHQTVGHKAGGGVCQADDTYAWDINLNCPRWDSDAGKPVYAVAKGVVCQTYGGCTNAGGSYGQVLIEHNYRGNTWWSAYLHLRDIQVSLGQSVSAATVIGYISNTSAEPNLPNHLHFVTYTGVNSQGALVSFNTTIVPRASAQLEYLHIWVDQENGTNSPETPGTEEQPFKSITYALALAGNLGWPEPWHIHIEPGIYDADPCKPDLETEVFPIKLRQDMILEGLDANTCIIDGQHLTSGYVPLVYGENLTNLEIRGLTLRNMDHSRGSGHGGAVELINCTGRIKDCLFENNLAINGGAFYLQPSPAPLSISGCTFAFNSAARFDETFGSGGALYVHGTLNGDIDHCIFTGNCANGTSGHIAYGGGAYLDGTLKGSINACTFVNNSIKVAGGYGRYGDAHGGALYIDTMLGDISDCAFTGNSARASGVSGDGRGGALFVNTLTGNLRKCTFTNNSAITRSFGGALYVARQLSGNMNSCVFSTNHSERAPAAWLVSLCGTIQNSRFLEHEDAAVYFPSDTNTLAAVRNCMITAPDSLASVDGWAIQTNQKVHISNNTIVGPGLGAGSTPSAIHIGYNTHAEEGQIFNNIFIDTERAIQVYVDVDMPIRYNQFYNVTDIVCQGDNHLGNDVWWLELLLDNFRNNAYGDPLFFPYGSAYHLQPISPCIDAGDPGYTPEPNETDFDGQSRVGTGRIDIGADEFYPYVLAADLYHDGIVDLADYGILSKNWLQAEAYADIAPPIRDRIVDFLDLAKLAEEWLQTESWY